MLMPNHMSLPGAQQPSAATPLTQYSPGTLAHLTPAQRAKALKKSKNVKVAPSMLSNMAAATG